MSRRPLSYYADKYGIPLRLARALIGQESGGRAGAVSPKGATGLTQVMPGTFVGMYGGTEAQARIRLRNPDTAMDAGFRYLARQKEKFGSWRLALAAYNAGPGAVMQYGGVPPYKETQNYVTNILGKAGVLGAGSSNGRMAGSEPVGGGSTPSPAAPLTAPVPTGPDLGAAANMGLADLASGQYDPMKALGDLASTARAAAPTPAAEPTGELDPLEHAPSVGPSSPAADGWEKYVIKPAARQGPSKPHQPAILQFVGRIGKRAGTPLEPWGNESHSLTTVNGNRSAHADGFAADIPAKGARLKRLGYLALLEAGMPKKDALKAARTGGLYNVGGYQIIFATKVGGNHFDHLHVGIRR